MMYTVTEDNFRNTFLTSDYSENFSYSGLTALYNYFEELENDTGQTIEFDLVGIAGEYSELTIDELRDNYSINNIISPFLLLIVLYDYTITILYFYNNSIFL